MLIKDTTDSPEHVMYRFTKVFPTVSCYEDQLVIADPVKFLMMIVLADCVLHCVNNRIAGYVDICGVASFAEKVGF